MDYIVPSSQEIIEHMGKAKAYGKLSIMFKPTEKTVVVMKLTHGPLKFRGVEYKKASRKYYIQLIEMKNNESIIISDEPCKDIVYAIDEFIKQIDFCCKMYGRVQKIICEWENIILGQ